MQRLGQLDYGNFGTSGEGAEEGEEVAQEEWGVSEQLALRSIYSHMLPSVVCYPGFSFVSICYASAMVLGLVCS